MREHRLNSYRIVRCPSAAAMVPRTRVERGFRDLPGPNDMAQPTATGTALRNIASSTSITA